MNKTVLAAIALLSLLGCKKVDVCHRVVGKEYVPARTYKGLMSTGKVVVPVSRHRGEKYILLLDSCKQYYGKSYVSKERYDTIQIGDTIHHLHKILKARWQN